jgi:hypothetical protein
MKLRRYHFRDRTFVIYDEWHNRWLVGIKWYWKQVQFGMVWTAQTVEQAKAFESRLLERNERIKWPWRLPLRFLGAGLGLSLWGLKP